MNSYKPIDDSYLSKLQEAVDQKEFIRIQFYSEINEFLTRNQVAKEIIKRNEAYYLVLANGEEIRLDRIVRFNNNPAPGYNESYFQCDI